MKTNRRFLCLLSSTTLLRCDANVVRCYSALTSSVWHIMRGSRWSRGGGNSWPGAGGWGRLQRKHTVSRWLCTTRSGAGAIYRVIHDIKITWAKLGRYVGGVTKWKTTKSVVKYTLMVFKSFKCTSSGKCLGSVFQVIFCAPSTYGEVFWFVVFSLLPKKTMFEINRTFSGDSLFRQNMYTYHV